MPAAHQTRDVPYAAGDMFDLVAGIELYPAFLPWCAAARIRKRERDGATEIVTADLVIAYKVFREQFTSRVVLDKAAHDIDVQYVQGPFKYLKNRWRFEALPDGGSRIHFFIDFEFRSVALQKLIGGVFSKAFTRMMQAFIARADELYGKRKLPPVASSEPLPSRR
ncbi:MAG TPA: type II toxin-antitoxin system RatA family toxin [Parvibaculum sp.]